MRRPYRVPIARLTRQSYVVLTIGLGLGAIAALVVALVLLYSSHKVSVAAAVGQWLLTVAAAFVFSGALTLVVKEIDQRRTERQAWQAILNDLGAVNHTVAMVRLYLAAERSVLTYQAQLTEIVRARLELRRISVIGLVVADPQLRDHINAMRRYLEALGNECQRGYLRVSRQQRLDEVWLTNEMAAASNGGGGAPRLPDELAEPTQAWDMLMDKEQFPRFAALLDRHAYRIDAFRINYKFAKRLLEIRSGFGDRAAHAWTFLAPRVVESARDFIASRTDDDLPAPVRGRVEEAAGQVESACERGNATEIEEATIALCTANWEAISCVYPWPEPKDTPANGRTTPAGEREGRPAPSPEPRGAGTET